MRLLDLVSEDHNGGCSCHFPLLLEAEGASTISPKQYKLKAKYDEFNKRYFDGALPEIPMRFGILKGKGGFVASHTTRQVKPEYRGISVSRAKLLGIDRVYGPPVLTPDSVRLVLSSAYNRSEQGFDGILLHEMIHVWQACVAGDLTSDQHGPVFMKKLADLRAKVPFDIPLTDDDTDENTITKEAIKPLGVLLFIQKDGTPGYAVISIAVLKANLEAFVKRWSGYVPRMYLKIAAYEITSALWSEIGRQHPVQRSVDYKTKRYGLRTPNALDDLLKNGTELANVPAAEVGSSRTA